MLPSSRGTASRARTSCINCRQGHFRCSEGTPCIRCSRRGLECAYDRVSLTFHEWAPAADVASSEPRTELEPSRHKKTLSTVYFISENSTVESGYHVLPLDASAYRAEELHGTASDHDEQGLSFGQAPLALAHLPPDAVSDPTEAFFMQRYCDIIGPWFDLFDTSRRHWTNTIPHLSLSDRTLFTAVLASCAKQYSLVSGEMSVCALDYYNHGLRELHRALNSPPRARHATIFASCLLIGYCEMINAKSTDWQTHLQGTRSLCSEPGWQDLSGGLAQACFQVYCRMDLLASVARAEHTLLSSSRWAKERDIDAAQHESSRFMDWWCNRVVLLLAQTHNLLCDVRHAQRCTQARTSPQADESAALEMRWDAVIRFVEIHDAARPIALRPIAELQPLDPNVPFMRIFYVSPAASAASQMLDMARLLCILAFPAFSQNERREHLTSPDTCLRGIALARRVVSNSITNRSSAAWVNAVQLLSSVGPVLPGVGERSALLRILDDIHNETGWSVVNHCQNLERTWNKLDSLRQRDAHTQSEENHSPALHYVGISLLHCADC